MRTAIARVGLGLLLCGLPGLAAAQDTASASAPAPATLAYLDGRVDLDREGVSDSASAPTLLVDGDRVRTRDGRAEVVFADGSLLHIDRDTHVEWLGPGHMRLLDGRVTFRVSASATAYLVDTAPGAVRLEPRGEYTLALTSGGPELQLSIVRGVGELEGAAERTVVRGGETLSVDDSGRPTLQRYNSARFDDFTRWSYERANGGAQGASAQYLPPELRAYGWSFDRYGRWDYAPSYGYVWYPTVAVGWRPYSHGGWRHTRYGWTWFGLDPWAGPTHHFGRWGFSGAAWFWIPNRVWGPAWVSWAHSPGYVSWSPLGWNGRPVFGFWNRPGRPYYDPWRAWTAIPRRHFGQRGPVQPWIIDGRRLPDSSRRAFVTASAPPAPVGDAARGDYAVPRPSRASGRPGPAEALGTGSVGAGRSRRGDYAVPRATAPAASWPTPEAARPAPSSTPRAESVPGGVRRQPRVSVPPAPQGAPALPDTAPVNRGTAPTIRDTAPTTMRRQDDPRTRSEYAVPRRSPDGGYRPQDADVFRGRNRARDQGPPPAGGQTSGQSSQPTREQSPRAVGREGASERSRAGGEGRPAAPPRESRPSNGEGTSRGASRRPPK